MLELLTNTILPFLFILTILVFVHELGHYLAAIKMVLKLKFFQLASVKKYLDILINPELDGNFQ